MPELEKFYFKKMGSQWSTRQSGPLALSFYPVLRLFLGFRPSQWSTRQSGPLALSFCPDLRLFPSFPTELVVHSTEWTTGS